MQAIMSYSCVSKLSSTLLELVGHLVAILFTDFNIFLMIIEVHTLLSSLMSILWRLAKNSGTILQKKVWSGQS